MITFVSCNIFELIWYSEFILRKQFILEKWIYMALMRFNSNKTWLKGISVSKHAILIPSVFFYMHFFASIYGQVC